MKNSITHISLLLATILFLYSCSSPDHSEKTIQNELGPFTQKLVATHGAATVLEAFSRLNPEATAQWPEHIRTKLSESAGLPFHEVLQPAQLDTLVSTLDDFVARLKGSEKSSFSQQLISWHLAQLCFASLQQGLSTEELLQHFQLAPLSEKVVAQFLASQQTRLESLSSTQMLELQQEVTLAFAKSNFTEQQAFLKAIFQ